MSPLTGNLAFRLPASRTRRLSIAVRLIDNFIGTNKVCHCSGFVTRKSRLFRLAMHATSGVSRPSFPDSIEFICVEHNTHQTVLHILSRLDRLHAFIALDPGCKEIKGSFSAPGTRVEIDSFQWLTLAFIIRVFGKPFSSPLT